MCKRYLKTVLTAGVLLAFISSVSFADEKGGKLFPTLRAKKEFASEVSLLIAKAWKKWQDEVIINNVDVEGARGLLSPGGINGPVLTSSGIMENFDRTGRSQDYINCVKAVSDAVADGMRIWQRGFSHRNIPFPQGVSCSYTLSPCDNVPVTVSSGSSSGDIKMSEEELYNYMLYRTPEQEESIIEVLKASAKAISASFEKWKKSCFIISIVASGGIAPAPAPMGTGPGPVRGAKGEGGKLVGSYFDATLMREEMVNYFKG